MQHNQGMLIIMGIDRTYAEKWIALLGDKLDAIPSASYLWECAQEAVKNNDVKLVKKYENLQYFLHNCYISPHCKLGKGVKFGYGGIGTVIHKNSVIGDGVSIGQNVTIGGTVGKIGKTDDGKIFSVPIIESHVYIAPGAKIIGPVTIKSYSVIGANAVVTKSFGSGSVVGGVPASLLSTIKKGNCRKYRSLFPLLADLTDQEYLSLFEG